MKRDKSSWRVSIIIVLLTTLLAVALGKWGGCINEFRAKSWKFEGRVVRLFYDSDNHGNATVDIYQDGEIFSQSLLKGSSYLFNELKVGDSIRKERWSLWVYVFRGEERFSIKLNFDCD